MEVHGEIVTHDLSVLRLATTKGLFASVVDERVTYVNAPQLAGVTMQALWEALPATGVPSVVRPVHRDDLTGFAGAAITYSTSAAQPVASIDDTRFAATDDLATRLRVAWGTVPWDVL